MRLHACALAAALLLPTLPAVAADDEKPVVEINTRAIDISISIEKELRAYPGLYDDLLAEARKRAAKWQADADGERRRNPKSFQDRKWSAECAYSQRSAIGRYISVLRDDDTYGGGAHGNTISDTILWDRDTKKRISIRPFFKEMADNGPTMTALARLAQLAVAAEKISRDDTADKKLSPEKYLADNADIKNGIAPRLLGIGPISLAPSTSAGKSSGLTFHYSPYVVGAYAEGPFIVFVEWAKFRQFLSREGETLFGGERPAKDAEDY